MQAGHHQEIRPIQCIKGLRASVIDDLKFFTKPSGDNFCLRVHRMALASAKPDNF